MSDEKMVTFRLRRSWLRTGIIVAVTVLVTATATAYADHNFGDVTPQNVFHDDIDWMDETQVTKGCNPPANTMYCPREEVTRQQMAAFMRRLAENQVVDAGSFMGSPEGDFAQDLQWASRPGTLTLTAANLRGGMTVLCPEGTEAISGGGRATASFFAMTGSLPTAARDGWRVEFEYTGLPGNVSSPVSVFALCAKFDNQTASPFPPAMFESDMVEAVPDNG